MNTITLNIEKNVYRLTLLGEGKFTDILVEDINEVLDKIDSDSDALALIITGEGKNFSQGYDIEFLGSCGDKVIDFRTSIT